LDAIVRFSLKKKRVDVCHYLCQSRGPKGVTPELATPWGSGGRRPDWRLRQLSGLVALVAATMRHPWTC